MSRAADRIAAAIRRRNFEAERETMTDDELDRRVVAAIRKAIVARGAVTTIDLARENIPMARLTPQRFARLIQQAHDEDPALAAAEATP